MPPRPKSAAPKLGLRSGGEHRGTKLWSMAIPMQGVEPTLCIHDGKLWFATSRTELENTMDRWAEEMVEPCPGGS